MKYLLHLSALLGFASLAAAQGPALVSEGDFLTDMPIVLSVSRLPQRLDETPGAVTLLDRDMIRRSGARDVADLLRLVPGFQASTSFESGAPIASYHGSFERWSSRLQVLIDGRSGYSPFLLGGTGHALQTVALQDIERIEVLRGSNSAAYGARAMLGVVNIVTRHTLETLGLQATLTGGENGVRDAQTHIGWGDAGASFRLALDQRGDDGLSGSNGHNQVKRVNFRADWRASARDEFQLRAGALVVDSGIGFAGDIGDPMRDRSFDSNYLQLDWHRVLGADQDLALSLSRNQESHVDNFIRPLADFGRSDGLIIDTGGRTRSDALSLQHTARHGANVRVVLGGEIRRETVNSPPVFNTDADLVSDFTRVFGNAEWRMTENLVLNAGALAEKGSESGSSVAPRLMLNWHVAPGQTLRAGISKAYRPPSTYEKQGARLFFSTQGVLLRREVIATGGAQPESIRVRELGYLADFPRLGINLDVRAFYEQTNGFIRQTDSSRPYDFVNFASFSIKGLEYQLKSRPWRGAELTFSQAYIDIGSFLGEATASAGDLLKFSNYAEDAPKLASALTLVQRMPGGGELSLMHQRSGVAGLVGSDKASAINRTDVRLATPLQLGRNRGEVALVVQNLGSPQTHYNSGFRLERRAFVTLRVEN